MILLGKKKKKRSPFKNGQDHFLPLQNLCISDALKFYRFIEWVGSDRTLAIIQF